jgi:hypothetical protein
MNDDRTDLEVFQQCRDLVFREWTSAANMCQRQVASTNGEARALVGVSFCLGRLVLARFDRCVLVG